MIVRKTEQGFVLVKQHDHGLLSGEFARNLSPETTRGQMSEGVLHAIANHDRAWENPDSEVLWNHEKDMPYSFRDHPPRPKTTAYSSFLDGMESEDPYSCLLCSKHYGTLAADSDEPSERRFVADEKQRRRRLRSEMSTESLGDFDRDFAVLRLSDDLSLFVCLNEPGSRDHPWYRNGISFMGDRISPDWADERTIILPDNILARDFEAHLPYLTVDSGGVESGCGIYEFRVIHSGIRKGSG